MNHSVFGGVCWRSPSPRPIVCFEPADLQGNGVPLERGVHLSTVVVDPSLQAGTTLAGTTLVGREREESGSRRLPTDLGISLTVGPDFQPGLSALEPLFTDPAENRCPAPSPGSISSGLNKPTTSNYFAVAKISLQVPLDCAFAC
jgi:hypothetical protein